MPVVGKGLDRKLLCIYHQGSSNNFLSSMHLLPESGTAIVVLTNSTGNNDTADWLGQLLLQTVLDVPMEGRHDYVALARESAHRSSRLWVDMAEELDKARLPNTQPRNLEQYVGKYFNIVKTFRIEVLQQDGQLKICFQGKQEQLYDLEHYNYDVFWWLLTRDEVARTGRFPGTRSHFYLLDFKASKANRDIDGLIWSNDRAVADGELFHKDLKNTVELSLRYIEDPN